ncbi:hypothetical protein M5225_000275 [Vibrio vulnificus]|uniref:hypothetical protein n=1 Tax=Vibrio TaxID=662 RepID=UPI0007A9D67F|nr:MULTISPECIES: hypothetical protein [Vibrio]HCH5614372.1 hypothetical protein [Vibrio parahaemolyticus]EHH1180615.1 hypothetical protein [Vibrio vulnificus]EHH1188662.1 hypothetical protein [Vibrio vulnificus]EHU4846335.1 hypothetical protein [Vibrio vulnificus]EHZ2900098.1 hypothetical protein [Vibrio vulnificus]
MCNQNSYSKYQKRVIKFLNELLGTETPFSYERTKTNHLKVLIDGVNKPLFTGSTPSDCKSLNNFMAEVKREIRAASSIHVQLNESIRPALPYAEKQSHDKLVKHCVKSLRSRLSSLKSQEEAKIIKSGNVDVLKTIRNEIVKHSVTTALRSRKQGCYLRPNELKKIEASVKSHLDFMLPSAAFYSDILNCAGSTEVLRQEMANTRILPEKGNIVTMNEPVAKTKQPGIKANRSSLSIDSNKSNSAQDLMSMTQNDRISVLQTLTKEQCRSLLDDLNQALLLKQEREIEEVVEMVREKQLPLDALMERLKTAA